MSLEAFIHGIKWKGFKFSERHPRGAGRLILFTGLFPMSDTGRSKGFFFFFCSKDQCYCLRPSILLVDEIIGTEGTYTPKAQGREGDYTLKGPVDPTSETVAQ